MGACCQSRAATGCLPLLIGAVILDLGLIGLLPLGVIIGFYPNLMNIVNDEAITGFAEGATGFDLLPLSRYMIAAGVFLLVSLLCSRLKRFNTFISLITLILMLVFLGLTAGNIGSLNQYKTLPPDAKIEVEESVWDWLYLGSNSYPR